MGEITRIKLNEEWAHAEAVEAGGFIYISYCMENEGQPIESQIHGAFNVLEKRLKLVGLGLDSVVQMDCLFKDIMDIHHLGDIIKERFKGEYPARKAYETKFLRDGILFQVDAVAFRA